MNGEWGEVGKELWGEWKIVENEEEMLDDESVEVVGVLGLGD